MAARSISSAAQTRTWRTHILQDSMGKIIKVLLLGAALLACYRPWWIGGQGSTLGLVDPKFDPQLSHIKDLKTGNLAVFLQRRQIWRNSTGTDQSFVNTLWQADRASATPIPMCQHLIWVVTFWYDLTSSKGTLNPIYPSILLVYFFLVSGLFLSISVTWVFGCL